MQQISRSRQSDESTEELASKVKILERDLYYYRKTSRDLRKKLQSASISSGVEAIKVAEELANSAPELEGSGRSQGRVKKRRKGPSSERGATTGTVRVGLTAGSGALGGATVRSEVSEEQEVLEEGIKQVTSVCAQNEVLGESVPRVQVLPHAGSVEGGGSLPSHHHQPHPGQEQQLVVKRSRKELRQLR